MSAVWPIVEYDAEPTWDHATKQVTWTSVQAVDLKWVSAARPNEQHTMIRMGGSPFDVAIRVDYADFMRDWMKARA